MTTRRSHGVSRTELPRSSELATVDSVPDRTEGRDASGRFTSGNPWAPGAKWRSLIASGLGRDLPGRAGELGRIAHRLYRVFLADMPCDCATVRSLVASRARAAALADAYAQRGAELGEGTPDGMACLGEALKWDARAERLAVTSLDVSTKLAGRTTRQVIDLGKVIEAASRPRSGGQP